MSGPTSRMLTLLSLLQTRPEWSGQVLADRLEVTVRTVRRDVDRLRQLGHQIAAEKGPEGGYRLSAGSELPPLLFDEEQAVAIAVALQSSTGLGVDIEEASERALATVRQVMPSRLRHRINGIRFTGTPTGVESPVDPGVLGIVSAATRERKTLRFGYRAGSEHRRTEPHAVVARGGYWYLIGWDLDREDWRIYRLDRMTPRSPTGPRFTARPLPASDPATYIAGRFKGSTSGDHWPCIGHAEIELPAQQIAPWLRGGEVLEVTKMSSRVTVGSWSWQGVLAALTRIDAPFSILGPEELITAAGVLSDRLESATARPGDTRS